MQDFPIDAVITWVDGDDPVHRAKRLRYENPDQLGNDEVGGEIRFRSIGEIKYCVASILRFAPFIRKIFIVTDGQDPQLDDFVRRHFPDAGTELEIVDHKVIYRGYEEMLPVFCSRSIETAVWRIPGLSEHYVYLNDDFLFVSPITVEDLFEDGKAICYANSFSIPVNRFLSIFKHHKGGKSPGFKDGMMNAALTLGETKRFLYLGHIPLAMRRSAPENYFRQHPEVFVNNMSYRFRNAAQYNPQELFYLLAIRDGICTVRPRKGIDLYIKPKNKSGYMASKLKAFDANSKALFGCFNSLSYASEQDRRLAIDWIERRLGLKK